MTFVEKLIRKKISRLSELYSEARLVSKQSYEDWLERTGLDLSQSELKDREEFIASYNKNLHDLYMADMRVWETRANGYKDLLTRYANIVDNITKK